jgi:uncharacterized protein (UPF0332 family)
MAGLASWTVGRDDVEALIEGGDITGLMERARQQLDSAAKLVDSDPVTAYVVAYDATKHAAMAILAEQDLRATGDGGHQALEKVLVAQFKGVFAAFSRLRRRRNELDYPAGDEDVADATEAGKAIRLATEIVDAADELLSRGVLTVF